MNNQQQTHATYMMHMIMNDRRQQQHCKQHYHYHHDYIDAMSHSQDIGEVHIPPYAMTALYDHAQCFKRNFGIVSRVMAV